MRDLIYFMPTVLALIDNYLVRPDYKHSQWFQTAGNKNQFGVAFPEFFSSRVHDIGAPWPVAATISPIPNIVKVDQHIENILDSIAEQIVKSTINSKKIPYLLWSGGIDSTAILVALLKNNCQEFLERLVIVHSDVSILENAYFYQRFVNQKLKTLNIENFSVRPDNYKTMLLLDGDAGNQVFGCSSIYNLFYRQPELLNFEWRNVDNVDQLLPGQTELTFKMIKESVACAPFEIRTVYDLLWWSNFNFKWNEVLARSMFYYAQHLSPVESQDFYQNSLFRFFEHPDIQRWAILYRDQRREATQLHPKWHVKKYIHDFDKNHLWFAHKQEAASGSQQTRATAFYRPNTVIGFDCEWNPIDLSSAEIRQELGHILERI